jgi:predicted GNAT family acetyltransferase
MNAQNQRFELPAGNDVAYIQYSVQQDTLVLLYIFVPVPFRGKGLSADLIRYALNYAKDHQLQTEVKCSFIARYLALHPEMVSSGR